MLLGRSAICTDTPAHGGRDLNAGSRGKSPFRLDDDRLELVAVSGCACPDGSGRLDHQRRHYAEGAGIGVGGAALAIGRLNHVAVGAHAKRSESPAKFHVPEPPAYGP